MGNYARNIKISVATQEDQNVISRIVAEIGAQLSSFAQGEGCFCFNIRISPDRVYGFRFSVAFNVSNKDKEVLQLYEKTLKVGKVRPIRDKEKAVFRTPTSPGKEKLYLYETESTADLIKRIIPFFQRFGFISPKSKQNFKIFFQIITILNSQYTLKDLILMLKLKNGTSNAFKSRRVDYETLSEIKLTLEKKLSKLKTYSGTYKKPEIDTVQEELDFLNYYLSRKDTLFNKFGYLNFCEKDLTNLEAQNPLIFY